MKTGIRRHLSYANIAATLALVLAIGGGTTAIALRGKNTVRTDDIRRGNVTARDLSQIRVINKVFSLTDSDADDGNWSGGFFILPCPKGTRIIGGGGAIGPTGNGQAAVTRTDINGNGWQISASQNGGNTMSVAVTALCLKRRPGPPITDN